MQGLNPEKIIDTIAQLELRIADRFPDSGLRQVVSDFLEITKKTQKNIEWISTPNIPARILAFLLLAAGIGGLAYSITVVDVQLENTTFENMITLSEAVFNDLVLLGAAIFFIVTLEARLKRKRAVKSLNELRVIAHVIDMHQLTKDPVAAKGGLETTINSPKRNFSPFELARYLDYCSEATALIAKVAVLYAQSLPDSDVVRSVNEIEVLTTGLSRKIWQKIIILNEQSHTNSALLP